MKYEIAIDRRELDRIISYMPAASRFAAHLGKGGSFENIFEEDGEDSLIIDTNEDGLCAFAYKDRRSRLLCSLHSAALHLKLPPYKIKPLSCVTWPLAITEDLPLQISIADDAFLFPCNTRKKNPGGSLDPNIEQIIYDVFGPSVLTGIKEADR